MPLIIHGVDKVGDVRILFEGDEPVKDGLTEFPHKNLRYKAYFIQILREQFPAIVPFLLGNKTRAYQN